MNGSLYLKRNDHKLDRVLKIKVIGKPSREIDLNTYCNDRNSVYCFDKNLLDFFVQKVEKGGLLAGNSNDYDFIVKFHKDLSVYK